MVLSPLNGWNSLVALVYESEHQTIEPWAYELAMHGCPTWFYVIRFMWMPRPLKFYYIWAKTALENQVVKYVIPCWYSPNARNIWCIYIGYHETSNSWSYKKSYSSANRQAMFKTKRLTHKTSGFTHYHICIQNRRREMIKPTIQCKSESRKLPQKNPQK